MPVAAPNARCWAISAPWSQVRLVRGAAGSAPMVVMRLSHNASALRSAPTGSLGAGGHGGRSTGQESVGVGKVGQSRNPGRRNTHPITT